jgi:hypothetical protein
MISLEEQVRALKQQAASKKPAGALRGVLGCRVLCCSCETLVIPSLRVVLL